MAHKFPRTDDELERLLAKARDQLVDSFREYDDAKCCHANEPGGQNWAADRSKVAKVSVDAWLDVCCRLRDQVEWQAHRDTPV